MSQSVQVKLFAVARQIAGADRVDLTLADGATVADLREALLAQLPALRPMGALLRFAVNSEYASDAQAISSGAEIACIPPVSGG